MIPTAYIQEWTAATPWPDPRQVEPLPDARTQITRANAEERMLAKLTRSLTDDIAPLLSADVVYRGAEAQEAFERVWFRLIARLSGEAWHRSVPVIEELRATSIPNLLRNPKV